MPDQSIPIDFSKQYTVLSTPEDTEAPEGSIDIDFGQQYKVLSVPEPPKPPEGMGAAFVRGAKESVKQIPQLAYGLLAGGAAAGESALGEGGLLTGVKEYAVDKYVKAGEEMAKDARPEDSMNYAYEQALSGDVGALFSWASHGFGYVGGQALTMLTGAGIGEKVAEVALKKSVQKLVGGMVEKEAIKLAEKSFVDKGIVATTEAIAARASEGEILSLAASETAKMFGRNATAAAFGYGMVGGGIGGDLAKQSVASGEALTGEEVAKGIAGTLLAGSLEYAGNMLGLSAMKGKLPTFAKIEAMPGYGGRVARGVSGGLETAAVEGPTEFAQTGIEQWAKGEDLSTDKAGIERIDALGLGLLGGGMGVVGGAITPPNLSKNHTVDDVLAEHRAKVAATSAANTADPDMAANTVAGVLNQPESPNAVDIIPSVDNPYKRIDVPVETGAANELSAGLLQGNVGAGPGAPGQVGGETGSVEQPAAIEQPNMEDVKRLAPHLREMFDLLVAAKKEDGSIENPDFVKKTTLDQWFKKTGEDVSRVGSGPARETLEAIRTRQPLNETQAKVWSYLKSVAENKAMQVEQGGIDNTRDSIDNIQGIPASTSINAPADRSAGELPADFGGGGETLTVPGSLTEEEIYSQKPKPLPKSKQGDLAAISEYDARYKEWRARYKEAIQAGVQPPVQSKPPLTPSSLSAEIARLKAKKEEAAVTGKLPSHLAGAKPRYSYGDKQFDLSFESDFDKAAYIAAQKTPSKRDADYVAWGMAQSGKTEEQLRAHGEAVRAGIKDRAKDSEGGVTLRIPTTAVATSETTSSGVTGGNVPKNDGTGSQGIQPTDSTLATEQGADNNLPAPGEIRDNGHEVINNTPDASTEGSEESRNDNNGSSAVNSPSDSAPSGVTSSSPEIISHTTKPNKQGKTKILRGVVISKDVATPAQLSKVAKYSFPKNGGTFVREKYIPALIEAGYLPAGNSPGTRKEQTHDVSIPENKPEVKEEESTGEGISENQGLSSPVDYRAITIERLGDVGTRVQFKGKYTVNKSVDTIQEINDRGEVKVMGSHFRPYNEYVKAAEPLKQEVKKAKEKKDTHPAKTDDVTFVIKSLQTGKEEELTLKGKEQPDTTTTDTTIESLQADLAATDTEIEELYKLISCLNQA